MNKTTITTSSQVGNGYETGNSIAITTRDDRLWKRIFYFLTFRKPPTKTTYKKVVSTSSTTITLVD